MLRQFWQFEKVTYRTTLKQRLRTKITRFTLEPLRDKDSDMDFTPSDDSSALASAQSGISLSSLREKGQVLSHTFSAERRHANLKFSHDSAYCKVNVLRNCPVVIMS